MVAIVVEVSIIVAFIITNVLRFHLQVGIVVETIAEVVVVEENIEAVVVVQVMALAETIVRIPTKRKYFDP